jgi:hypothetical protein
MAGNISPNTITDGLILELDAANQRSYISGSASWNDLTGNLNNGTLLNGPAYTNSGSIGVFFDGTDDYGTIPYTIQSLITNKMSVCVWINPQWFDSGNNDGVTIFNKCMPSAIFPYTIYFLGLNPSGKFLSCVSDGNNRTILTSDSTLSLNTWVYLCFTYDGATLKSYKNGVQETTTASAVYSSIGQNTVTTNIASNQTLGSFYDRFKGNIGIISMYNRALSAAEILQNYTTTKTRFGL